VESKNSKIQLLELHLYEVTRQLDGALLSSSSVCQREALKNVLVDVFNCTVSLKRGC
jgi:hypothetical protein